MALDRPPEDRPSQQRPLLSPRQATVPVPSEPWVEELHSLNCPFSFSGYSFPAPQTQRPQVIGNQSFRKPFSLRSPNHPTPKSWLKHSLGLREDPDESAESQQQCQESCRRYPSFLRRSLRCEGLTRGRVSGEKHTCVSHLRWPPAKAMTLSFPARQSALQGGYSYSCRQPEKQEVAQKRGPTPTAGHTLRGHPQLLCPGRGRVLFQTWSSDLPSHHRRRVVSRARKERATASLLYPPGPGWQDHRFLSQPCRPNKILTLLVI